MGNRQLIAVCAWLLAASSALAQAPPPQPKELPPLVAAPAAPAESAPVVLETPAVQSEFLWFRTEYMFWALPASRVNIPIVTTGNPVDDCFAGIVGQPSTQVLFGNKEFTNTEANSLQFTLGAWFDNAHDVGFESTGFVVFRKYHQFDGNDNGGKTPLYLSGFNTQLNREDSAIIADPIQQFGGSIKVTTDLNLWGGEINALFNMSRTPTFQWNLLTGVRYLELHETFSLSAVSRDLILNQQITLDDRFETTNRFLGYQLGSRFSWRFSKILFDVTAKVALGGNEESKSIYGQSTSTGPDATNPGTFPGGFYAQPTNMDRRSEIVFAVMPAFELKLGYQLTPYAVASFGYQLFYLNETIRVANQIDRNLNLAQSSVLGSTSPAAAPAPRQQYAPSDFFAQGINFGLEFRY